MPERKTLVTSRLHLRPTRPDDARSAYEIQSNWNVCRMLAQAAYPPDAREIAAWFRSHPDEWAEGSAFRFAVTLQGAFIGLADFDEVSEGEASLGYWLSESAWGHGFAREAAGAVVRFAFDDVGLSRLRAGHAEDNLASGKVLTALGFKHVSDGSLWSRSRQETVRYRRYLLVRD